MSLLAPPPPPPFPHHRPRRGPMAIAIAIVSLLLLGGVAAVTKALDERGPSHPDRWDSRVAALAAFVESERGLAFDHPVFVDFLTAADYSKQTTNEPAGATKTERDDLDRYADELRALGVASGPLDLATAFNQISDGGTLAFYDPRDQRIRVRGQEITVGLEVTLVHELTHALQDQSFDLDRLSRGDADTGASTALRGLAEGDAIRVEEAYADDELSSDERRAYDAEYAGELADSQIATADVPDFVSATFSAPYALGLPFAVLLDNLGGNDRVDRAFANPPDTEEQLFDPTTYLDEEGSGIDVELGFPDDAELFDEGPFGATSWYLFLAERIDPKVAFEAALGWNGDAFAAREDGGRTCLRVAFAGDTERDETQMAAALAEWIEAMPGDVAELDEVDGHPVLATCDPGEDVDLELTGRSASSLYLPSLWGYLVADAATVVDPPVARCYARAVIAELSYEDIVDPDGAALSGDTFQQTLSDAFSGCA